MKSFKYYEYKAKRKEDEQFKFFSVQILATASLMRLTPTIFGFFLVTHLTALLAHLFWSFAVTQKFFHQLS